MPVLERDGSTTQMRIAGRAGGHAIISYDPIDLSIGFHVDGTEVLRMGQNGTVWVQGACIGVDRSLFVAWRRFTDQLGITQRDVPDDLAEAVRKLERGLDREDPGRDVLARTLCGLLRREYNLV